MKLAMLALCFLAACDEKADAPSRPAPAARPASIPESSVALLDQYAAGARGLAALAQKGDCAAALPAIKALTPLAAKILVDADVLDRLSTTDADARAWLGGVYQDRLTIATHDILAAVKSGACIENEAFKASVIELSLAMGAKPN